MVTLNLASLYTDVPHDLGTEAANYSITTYRESLYLRFKKEFAIESVEFILKNNAMAFNFGVFLAV